MEKESITFLIRTFIWEIGRKINSQETESISIQTAKNIKENSLKATNPEEESTLTKVELFTKDNGLKIEKADSAFMSMQINKNIKVVG